MKTNINNTATENNNRVNNIIDFGAKIGGARKDMYQAANEWAARLADITAAQLSNAGLSKLVKLPNLEKLTAAGVISAEAARAALVIWRSIDRKPTYGASRWAESTRVKLNAIAAALTENTISQDTAADPEYLVLTAANWPAEDFTFGKYRVRQYATRPDVFGPAVYKLRIVNAHYYIGEASQDPADIAAQLRTMTEKDDAESTARRAAGPKLSVYINRAGQYFITPDGRPEIVLNTYETREEAFSARRENRAALVARYNALKNFPDCRREWNRPRVGEDWRNGENMTPEKFAAALPFRGVEFGNWVSQTERAALLNSAYDGFHDLAAVLGISPAAVCLNGSLAFAFASRGHSGASAHYEPARRVINLTKRTGAGCMAHEWFHAVDNWAAGGGVRSFATEGRGTTAAAILEAIKKTDYYTRSKKLATYKNNPYWVEGCELTARAFEGVCAVLLNAAGICSDFLVNCIDMDEFTQRDIEHRSNCYPYPTAAEAAALLPLYVAFLNEVFNGGVHVPAAALAESESAAKKADAERKEAERVRAERLAAQQAREEAERNAREEKAAREAEERKQRAASATAAVCDMLKERHFDHIATGCDSAAVYAVAHLEGEIYTLSADIKTAQEQGESYINSLKAARVSYKRAHNAKRVICHRYPSAMIRANKWNAAELVKSLQDSGAEVRGIVKSFEGCERADVWQYAENLWQDTQKSRSDAKKTSKADNIQPSTEKAATGDENTPSDGLRLVEIAGGVAVVADDWKTTYFNRRAIKAHGCKWNKTAGQWQATTAEDVATVRAWFGISEQPETTAEEPAAEPLAIAASMSTAEEPAAVFVSSATNEEKAAAPAKWMERAPILEKILFEVSTPEKSWLCPYFGARDMWAAYCGNRYHENAAQLEEWALTAHGGDTATFGDFSLTVHSRGDVCIYTVSTSQRTPQVLDSFRSEQAATCWLKGTAAHAIEGVKVLKVAPDCLILFDERENVYYCYFTADHSGKALHGCNDDYRGLLLEYRKRHQVADIAGRIEKTAAKGCTYVTSTADRRACVKAWREQENGVYVATWYAHGEADETRTGLKAEDVAEMVWTFVDGYATEADDIITEEQG